MFYVLFVKIKSTKNKFLLKVYEIIWWNYSIDNFCTYSFLRLEYFLRSFSTLKNCKKRFELILNLEAVEKAGQIFWLPFLLSR